MTRKEREARARMRRFYQQLVESGIVWIDEEDLPKRLLWQWRLARVSGYIIFAVMAVGAALLITFLMFGIF